MTTASVVKTASVPLKPDALADLLGFLILVISALWWMAPVLLSDGWPMNHEILSLFERVEAFRRELAHGHWYPLWSPYLQSGYGSSFPLFYHRLFPWMTAAVSLISGASVIASVKAVTAVLLIIACLGIRELLRTSGATDPWAVAGALLFLVSPYVLTDWLVRGALAEFTALAILPWLYASLCRFIQGTRPWITIALELVLLFHAHSMICYFFLLSALGFLAYSLVGSQRTFAWRGVGRQSGKIAIAAVIVIVGIIPQVIVAGSMLSYFNMEALSGIPNVPLKIHENYRAFADYFADDSFHWGLQWKGMSVEINRYAVIAAVLLHLLPGATPRWRWVWRVPLYPFLLVWTLICLALQLPALEFVFNALPGGHYLQFAWRLLAFMTVGMVFVVISSARQASRAGGAQHIIAVVCVTLAILLTVRLVWRGRLPQDWTDPEIINADIEKLDGNVSFGEYLLKGMRYDTPLPDRPLIQAIGCESPLHVTDSFQHGDIAATADEPAACKVSIRQLQSPLLAVELQGAELVSHYPSKEILIALNAGKSSIRVRPRTFGEMLVRALRGR